MIDDKEMQAVMDNWAKWERDTFPQATTSSRLHHLLTEVKELLDKPGDLMEYADAMALLGLAARSQGYSLSHIFNGMRTKLVINKGRQWGEPNDKGFVEHVK